MNRIQRLHTLALAAGLACAGAAQATTVLPAIVHGDIAVNLTPVATGLAAPDYAISAPGDASRLFVVEQNGLLRVIQNGVLQAAPALDIMRLEIESKKDRDYQWVVHHVEKPASVEFEDRKYREVATLTALADRTWFYDAGQKNFHVRVKVKAGEDCIINLNFE